MNIYSLKYHRKEQNKTLLRVWAVIWQFQLVNCCGRTKGENGAEWVLHLQNVLSTLMKLLFLTLGNSPARACVL